MRVLPVPGGLIELHEDGLTLIHFTGGLQVHARSHPTLQYRRRAREHGYDDVDLMSREHEVAHHLLAKALGLPRSPTLSEVAKGPGNVWWGWRDEEAAVLALQRYSRRLGLDLVAVLERPG